MRYILFIAIGIGLLSCKSLDYFKPKIRTEYNISDKELYYLQYYLEGAVQLEYINIEAENEVNADNSLRRNITEFEKTILIGSGTPGILDRADGNILHINVDDRIILGFTPANNNPESNYILTFVNNKRVRKGSKVEIEGLEYIIDFGTKGSKTVFFETNEVPKLKYDFSEKLKRVREEEKIKGKRL